MNGSYTVFKQNIPDTVLHFAAGQTSHAAGLLVKVQASQSPTIESSWTDLVTGRAGLMTFRHFLAAIHPQHDQLSFAKRRLLPRHLLLRATSSASRASWGPSILRATKPTSGRRYSNGEWHHSDLYFDATQSTSAAALRVQLSATPANGGSWTDLNDGVAGHISRAAIRNTSCCSKELPATSDVYFRAVAHLDGAIIVSPVPLDRLPLHLTRHHRLRSLLPRDWLAVEMEVRGIPF